MYERNNVEKFVPFFIHFIKLSNFSFTHIINISSTNSFAKKEIVIQLAPKFMDFMDIFDQLSPCLFLFSHTNTRETDNFPWTLSISCPKKTKIFACKCVLRSFWYNWKYKKHKKCTRIMWLCSTLWQWETVKREKFESIHQISIIIMVWSCHKCVINSYYVFFYCCYS